MAEKGFKVITVKEKYYKKVKDYYKSLITEEIDKDGFIKQARQIQEETKKSKTRKMHPLAVKKIWTPET